LTDVIYIGAFLLEDELAVAPTRIEAARSVLAMAVPGLQVAEASELGGAILTTDRPTGTARLAPFLLDAGLVLASGPCELLVGHSGVAALVARRQVDLARIRDHDSSVAQDLEGLRAAVASASRSLRDGGDARSWPADTIRHDQFLWWHRVIVSDAEPGDLHPNLVFGVSIAPWVGDVGVVAQGFSLLRRRYLSMADDLVRGLFAATEEWIAVDTLDRRVSAWISVIRDRDQALELAEQEVRAASAAVLGRRVFFEERARYLRNAALAGLDAARTAWHIELQLTQMHEHLHEIRTIVAEEAAQRGVARDRRRNEYLFAFTLLAVLQTLLAIFDFATNGNESIVSIARVLFGGIIVCGGAFLVIRAWLRNRGRRGGE
jgi:hypothetical protein